ncbi:MAG: FGGY family carbohydrate kinase [Bacteroidota bacterium]
MYSLGYDIGSSSIKAVLLNLESGSVEGSAFSPKTEMPILAVRPGWAEQDPAMWWDHLKSATAEILTKSKIKKSEIGSIGISYQMHGLVVIDKDRKVLRPSIIWCDSRAVEIGDKAFAAIGPKKCLGMLLNSPGNFTASKLRWVRENEPDVYKKIDKFFLPGDYIGLRLTGEAATTISGLSEGILWNFKTHSAAADVLSHYDIGPELIPKVVPTFGDQGKLSKVAATELGLPKGIPVTYRAGDQPNNALSLNVMEPGEIASTAGTSGVVYGVSDSATYDRESRVNSFAHVNHEAKRMRIGILLCINGTGIANSWIRKMLGKQSSGYDQLNQLAASVPVGSEGVVCLPFGNGAERMLKNRDLGARLLNVQFNTHSQAHVARAVQEGIACAFTYGMDIMRTMDVKPSVIRAGFANMFLSPVFCESLAEMASVAIELYNTDGAQGAARGAAFGAKLVSSREEMFKGLRREKVIEPDEKRKEPYRALLGKWTEELKKIHES